MTYLANIIDDIASSDALFTFLVVALIIVFLATLYLMYAQGRVNDKNIMAQKSKSLNANDMIGQALFGENDNFISSKNENIISEVSEATSEMEFPKKVIEVSNISNNSIDDSSNDDIPYFLKESEYFKSNNKELEDTNISETYEKNVFEPVLEKEEIHKDPYKEIMLDNYLSGSSLKKINVVEEPEEKEFHSDDDFDLIDVTRELEAIPKERTIALTEYEAEQEEKAIISYDELIKNIEKNNVDYYEAKDEFDAKFSIDEIEELKTQSNKNDTSKNLEKVETFPTTSNNNVDVSLTNNTFSNADSFKTSINSEVDLNKEEINKGIDVTSYEHEEAFLDALKQLQNILN